MLDPPKANTYVTGLTSTITDYVDCPLWNGLPPAFHHERLAADRPCTFLTGEEIFHTPRAGSGTMTKAADKLQEADARTTWDARQKQRLYVATICHMKPDGRSKFDVGQQGD